MIKVLDAGHAYLLGCLDGEINQVLQFVKREGAKYPGNVGVHPGTTTQDVLVALIDRTKYVDAQIYDYRNNLVIAHLREAVWLLEERASEQHGYTLRREGNPENIRTDAQSGHFEHLWKLPVTRLPK